MAASPLAVASAAAGGFALGAFINIGLARRTDAPDPGCPRCGAPTSFIGNIPFVSWFRVTIRCSRCDWRETTWFDWGAWLREVAALHRTRGVPFTASHGLVGLAFALAWATAIWFAGGWNLVGLHHATLLSALLAIALSDAAIKIIPGEYTLPGILAGIALAAAGAPPGLAASVAGCLVGAGLIWAIGVAGTKVFGKEAMGGGDIDLMAMVGAFLGTKAVFLTVFLGSAVGSLVYLPLLLVRRDWGQQIPFGVYLAAGAVVAMFFGDALVSAYLRFALQP